MRSALTAFVLVLAFAGSNALSPCAISCPKDCEFGVVFDRSEPNCVKCVCSDNICARVRCAGRCELTKTKDCWLSQCIDATTVKCVPVEETCKIACPKDCEFGLELERSNPDCPTCQCTVSPCARTTCVVNTECQLVKEKQCFKSQCVETTSAQCVPIGKPPCKLTCPKDCKFGVKLDRPNPDCPTCTCAENGCTFVKCNKDTNCQLVKTKECFNSQCIEVSSPRCVPNENTCKITCPPECKFGFKLDRTNPHCPTCTCSPDPCSETFCIAITNCRPTTKRECFNSQCFQVATAACVPIETECEVTCPKTCKFGVTFDRSNPGCPTCSCAENGCNLVDCAENTRCELVKSQECFNSRCFEVLSPKCVPNENTCKITCPKKCEFGVKLDRSNPDCPTCTCSDNPCSNVFCIATHSCQKSTKRECIGSQCFDVAVGNCVRIPIPCEITCPQNCEQGFRLDRSNPGCPSCACAITSCANVRCRSGTTCETVKTKECFNSQCIEVSSPSCVPVPKPGSCPLGSAIANLKPVECKTDSDCNDDLKCCSSKNNRICTAPCFEVACKCAIGFKTIFETDPNGCSICNCVPVKPTCEITCPKKCEFGFKLDRPNPDCPTCTCAENGCTFVKCNIDTNCQLVKTKECFNSQCIEVTSPKCVPNENTCKITCPKGCQYGVKLDRKFNPNCPTCTCSANPCEEWACIATHTCKASTKKDCWNTQCFDVAVHACVPIPIQCEITCPQDCELGFRLDRSNPDCPSCACAIISCANVRCRSGTTCEMVKTKECFNSQCIEVSSPSCVPDTKPGNCPAGSAIAYQKPVECTTDSDCKDDLKCCSSKNSKICTAPCPVVLCKCAGTHRVVYEPDSKGCPMCTCVPIDENPDPCSQSLKVGGDCPGKMRRFYYHAESNTCKRFTFTGCKGNSNNFLSLMSCENRCVKSKNPYEDTVDACDQPMKVGPCKRAFERFYYDKETKSCRFFYYGGCMPNDNNFETLGECRKRCESARERPRYGEIVDKKPEKDEPANACALPKEVGPCRASLERYYYDTETKSCRPFFFGGCQGNSNNFKTLEECKKRCDSAPERPKPGDLVKNKCHLPKRVGECRAAIPRYFYSLEKNSCEEFLYSGCSGNDNNFGTMNECKKECLPDDEDKLVERLDAVCKMPRDFGACRGSFRRFYFDLQTKSCQEFFYGGCEGNKNNFEKLADCHKRCGAIFDEHNYNLINVDVRPKSSKCLLPKVVGKCRAAIPRFYFDTQTKKCLEFSYGGCDGNENNFETLDQCEDECTENHGSSKQSNINSICKLPQVPGPCRGAIARYSFDSRTRQCVKFTYGGCQGNDNNFMSEDDCLNFCAKAAPINRCYLAKDSGPCEAAIPAFFFNANTGRCESFVYGGCQGNQNRFSSLAECAAACQSNPPVTSPPFVPRCALPKATGSCKGYVVSFYYDRSSGRCEQFVYTGCEGNANRFETLNECLAECAPSQVTPPSTTLPPNKCHLKSEQGPCKALFIKFYFNKDTGKCQTFTYGGCQGNANRFDTLDECTAECGPKTTPPKQSVCTMSKDTGPCYGLFSKFYFNSQTKQCESFDYGGCQGNGNRFDSKEECLKTCGSGGGGAVTPPVTTIPPPTVPKCLQEKEMGPCRGHMERYFFNKISGQCQQFVYGGCGGNDNRFSSLSECSKECAAFVKPAPPVNTCQLDAEPGNCKAAFKRFYFNRRTGNCETFTYGGCGGNNNRFETLAECNARCGHKQPKCLLPKSPGRCLAFFPRYYYDVTTMRCERFVFGGCEANENNFETIQGCIKECSDMSIYQINAKCKQPVDRGSCTKFVSKYFFNARTNACEEFKYGGCGGNENRFDDLDECSSQCFNLKPANNSNE